MTYSIKKTDSGNYSVVKETSTGSYVIAIDHYEFNCRDFIRQLEGNGKVNSKINH